MNYEQFDTTPEAAEEPKLSAFQAPSFSDMAGQDLMPKIRFTTDAAEADEAAQADRSDPFHLPDSVFHVGDGSKGDTPAEAPCGAFQNESFGIDVSSFATDTAGAESGDYVGPSIESLDLKIENDVKDLTYAQEQLALAIERGTGVMTAMQNVENAQAVLDGHMKLYNEAIQFRPPEVSASLGEAKLGSSVSHAQWKLEQAYKDGNKIAIENAKRELAHEKAKKDAKS